MYNITIEEYWENEGPGESDPTEWGEYATKDEALNNWDNAIEAAKNQAWDSWRDSRVARMRIRRREDDRIVLVSLNETDGDGEPKDGIKSEAISVRKDIAEISDL